MIVNKNGSIPVTADMIQNSSAIPQEMIGEHQAAVAAYKKERRMGCFAFVDLGRTTKNTYGLDKANSRAHQYESSEQWVIDLNKISMAQGTEYLIQINGDHLQLNFVGGSQVPINTEVIYLVIVTPKLSVIYIRPLVILLRKWIIRHIYKQSYITQWY